MEAKGVSKRIQNWCNIEMQSCERPRFCWRLRNLIISRVRPGLICVKLKVRGWRQVANWRYCGLASGQVSGHLCARRANA